MVLGIKCKTKASWKWKVYEQVEGHVSSRASRQAVQCVFLGGLWRRSSSSSSIPLLWYVSA